MLFTIGGVDYMHGTGGRPCRCDEINEFSVARKLKLLEPGNQGLNFVLGGATTNQQSGFFAIGANLPKLARVYFIGAGRDFLALNFSDEGNPATIGSKNRIRV